MTDTIFTTETPATIATDTDVRNLGMRFHVTAINQQVNGGRVWIPAAGLPTVAVWQVWDEAANSIIASYDLHNLAVVTPGGWNAIPALPETTAPLVTGNDYIVNIYSGGQGNLFEFVYTSPASFNIGTGVVVSTKGMYRNGGTPADIPTNEFDSYHFADVSVDSIGGEPVPVAMACECDRANPIAVEPPPTPVPVGMACECDRAKPIVVGGKPDQPRLAELIWAIAKALRDCLCERLEQTLGGPVCRCSLMSGETAIADICTKEPGQGDGQAWVRMTRLFVSQEFPRPLADTLTCAGAFWAAEFEIGVLRCGIVPDENGQPPTAEELNAEAAKVFDDSFALRVAAECCLPSSLPSVPGDWQPMGGGGCIGGRASVTVQLLPGPHNLTITGP